jgi:hypothetical protein
VAGGLIELRGDNPAVLDVGLDEILRAIEPFSAHLVWSILDLNAEGRLTGRLAMRDLMEEVEQSPRGVVMDWPQFRAFARDVSQVVDGIFVGCRDAASIPALRQGADLLTPSEIVLQAIDSTLWQVYARDERVLQRIEQQWRSERVPLSVGAGTSVPAGGIAV